MQPFLAEAKVQMLFVCVALDVASPKMSYDYYIRNYL